MDKDKIARIAVRNDLLRKTFIGGKVVITRSVADSSDRDQILTAVKSFSEFTKDNDPYGERDCATVQVNGSHYIWKIDYYDPQYQFFEENGNRVLTIMRAEEY